MKSVLITGCSGGGIGAALAITFQKTGQYHVFATARTISKIPAELVTDEKNVTVLALDVTSPESIEKAKQAVSVKTGGRLDVLVNNSGHAFYGQPAIETKIELAKSLFDVNYFGVMAMTTTFLPLLVMAKGVIVNNSSIAGERWLMYNSCYGASKAALTMYSECLRLEVAALGVRVIILATGTVMTNVLTNQPAVDIPEKSFWSPITQTLKMMATEFAGGQPVDEYAMQVVQTVESGASGKFWLGNMATMFKVLKWFPSWVWDQINYSQNKEQHKLTPGAERFRAGVSD